jgi:hypothetical protein
VHAAPPQGGFEPELTDSAWRMNVSFRTYRETVLESERFGGSKDPPLVSPAMSSGIDVGCVCRVRPDEAIGPNETRINGSDRL